MVKLTSSENPFVPTYTRGHPQTLKSVMSKYGVTKHHSSVKATLNLMTSILNILIDEDLMDEYLYELGFETLESQMAGILEDGFHGYMQDEHIKIQGLKPLSNIFIGSEDGEITRLF